MKPSRLASAAIAAASLALHFACWGASVDPSIEFVIKSTYLFKFAGYVQWPDSAFSSPTAPLNLCIVGEDPFGPGLDKAINGQQIDGRAIAVQRMQNLSSTSSCHILYLALPDPQRLSQNLAQVRGQAVLSVSDLRGSGACIDFVIKDNRVRFNIDEDVAARNGLVISSKLLSVALHVNPRLAKIKP